MVKKITKSKVPMILSTLIILLFSTGPIAGSIWQENYVSAQSTTVTPIKHLIAWLRSGQRLRNILKHIKDL
jgi:hypothetical protein